MNFSLDLGRSKTNTDQLDQLRLIRSENVGPVTFYGLISRFGSAGKALDALPELAIRGGLKRKIKVCSKAEARQEYDAGVKAKASLLTFDGENYPPLLNHLDDAPPVLWAKGNTHLLLKKSIGIVGSRNASAAGRKVTSMIAAELGQFDMLVTSGLARGIDGAAHAASLATGTCAVLAGGVDQVYPPQHETLYQEIAEQGVILSEMPIGQIAQARHFPRRNRLVSGISMGVLVIEAALRSGSLITARFANEQGRAVFAIPGSPLDQRASGTNDLIKQGAHLVEKAEDILEILAPMGDSFLKEPDQFTLPLDTQVRGEGQPLVSEEQIDLARPELLSLLGPVPTEIDELVRLSNISPAIVISILVELELAGRLDRQPGQKVALIDA